MVRCWAMAPTKHNMTLREAEFEGATFDERWGYDLRHGVIFIGFDVGAIPDDRAHLAQLWDETTFEELGNRTIALRMLGYFWFDIQPGDVVVARAGVNQYVGYGVFQGEPWYDENAYGDGGIRNYYSFRHVDWAPIAGRRRTSLVRFSRNTLYPITEDKVARFRGLPDFPMR